MKLGITAASGHLGAAIIRQLLKQKPADKIVGMARTLEKAKGLGVEIRKGDYENKHEFLSALADVDVLLLVSSMAKPKDRPRQHGNVIEAAKECGVKKIVYTSIIGSADETDFAPIVASNRETEKMIENSGMEWVIGRNGLYIEPDLNAIPEYQKTGVVANCANGGRCSYTTRDELGFAFTNMMLDNQHNGHIYNLTGPSLTQQELVDFINTYFGLHLKFQDIPVEEFKQDRLAAHGEHLGTIIAGIYDSIRRGHFNVDSDFTAAAGRLHLSWPECIQQYKRTNS